MTPSHRDGLTEKSVALAQFLPPTPTPRWGIFDSCSPRFSHRLSSTVNPSPFSPPSPPLPPPLLDQHPIISFPSRLDLKAPSISTDSLTYPVPSICANLAFTEHLASNCIRIFSDLCGSGSSFSLPPACRATQLRRLLAAAPPSPFPSPSTPRRVGILRSPSTVQDAKAPSRIQGSAPLPDAHFRVRPNIFLIVVAIGFLIPSSCVYLSSSFIWTMLTKTQISIQ